MGNVQTVYVVDDNAQMRESVSIFLTCARLNVETFDSARSFLNSYDPERESCLILDIQMPEMSGLELQRQLLLKKDILPIIVVSGNAGVMDAVQAMKMGCFEFIEKPYFPELLLKRVLAALEHSHKTRIETSRLEQLRSRLARLTDREMQILGQVVSGRPSKLIADQMGVSTSTVDNHRANIMKKLKAETSADLARIAMSIDPSLGIDAKAMD